MAANLLQSRVALVMKMSSLCAKLALCACVSFTPLLSSAAPQADESEETVDYNIKDDRLSQEEIEKAESLFFEGFVMYQKKEFEKAAELFQRAYALVPQDDLLYNVARSREQMGDKQLAIAWYQAYLKTKPVDETTIIHRLKLLGGAPKAASLPAEALGPGVVREVAPLNLTPWLVSGAGVALLGAGVWYGLSANDNAKLAREAELETRYKKYKSAAESDAFIADLAFITGALSLLGGVYLWLVEDKQEGQQLKGDVQVNASASASFQFGVSPNGARLGYSWSF